jgi:hypothetical protein
MSDSGAIRAGRAYVELYGEDTGFDAMLAGGDQKLKSFGERVTSTGRSISSSFGSAIGTIISTVGVAASATLAMGTAGLATMGFGKAATKAAAMTGDVTSELRRLTPLSEETWAFMSSGIRRGSVALGAMIGLLKAAGPAGQPLLDLFRTMNSRAAGSLSSPLQLASMRGLRSSRLRGDTEGADMYRGLLKIADAGRLSQAWSQGIFKGIGTGIMIGTRRAFAASARGSIGLVNNLTAGLLGRAVSALTGNHSVSMASGTGAVGTAAGGAAPKVSRLASALGSAATASGGFFRSITGKAAMITGLAAGVVGMFSAASGFDLRTVSSRLMNSKSFATGAKDLNERGNAMVSLSDVNAAERLTVAMETMFQAAEAAWAQIGAAVAPLVARSLTSTAQWVAGVARWMNANRELVGSLFAVAQKIFMIAGFAAVAVKGTALIAPVILALLNPIAAVGVALVAGVAAWLYWSDEGNRVIAWLQTRFGDLLKTASQIWRGIVAAVGSGDLALAGEIAFVGIELAFLNSVKAMGGNWTAFQSFWIKSVNLIGDAWDTVLTRFQTGWRSAQNVVAKGITSLLGLISGQDVSEQLTTLDEMATHDNKATTAKRDKSITDREAAMQRDLAALPASDEERIAALKAQLQALVAKAESAAGAPFAAAMPKAASDPDRIRSRIAGTFNAAAVQGLGAGSAVEKIVENTKETAKQLDRIAKMVRDGRGGELAFGNGQ